MKKLIALVLALVCVLGLVSCVSGNNENEKEVNTITDFSKFSDMTKDGTDKIDVTFDNNTGVPFYFTIEEKEDIDEIMNIIFSSSFEKCGEMNGSHTSLNIIQGEKEYKMHISTNKEGNNNYSFSTEDLFWKIQELGEVAGAYDNVKWFDKFLFNEQLFYLNMINNWEILI